MRREYLRYSLPPERIHTIPLFTTPPASRAADQHTPLDVLDVLFLGRMTPLKGTEVLLVRAVGRAAQRPRPSARRRSSRASCELARPALAARAAALGR